MATRAQIDFNDLTNLLAAEINAGIKYIEQDVRKQPGINIDSIKVSLGQAGCEDEGEDPDQDEGENQSFINRHLYALADKGWNYEMIVSTGEIPVNVKIIDQPDDVIKPVLPGSAIDLFKEDDLKAIKGVDDYWGKVFKKYNLNTIGDVFKADIEKVYDIVDKNNNLYPLNIYSKVSMINISIPIVPKQLKKNINFLEILKMSPNILVDKVGNRYLSESGAIRLILFVSRLYTLIDGDVLKDKYLL